MSTLDRTHFQQHCLYLTLSIWAYNSLHEAYECADCAATMEATGAMSSKTLESRQSQYKHFGKF